MPSPAFFGRETELMTTTARSPNELLAVLPAADFELIRVHLRTVDLVFGEVLVPAGGALKQVYFPHSGIISSMVNLGQGETIEVAMIGRDGVFGGSAALYGAASPTGAIVRYSGTASVVDVADFRAVAERSAALRAALMRYQWLHIIKAEQTAACNASHSVEARLCRRLLQSRELSGSDRLPLTQDAMAQMLAVQRNTISLVAHALQHAGVIRYSRGRLEITNIDDLIERSCECYEADHPNGRKLQQPVVDEPPVPRAMVAARRSSDEAAQRRPS
jgi:CRP-like cAMP-binding protein